MEADSNELSIRGPILIPAGWLVAIVGAAGTAILLAISATVYIVTQSTKAEAVSEKVNALEQVYSDVHRIDNRLTRIETIITIAYPGATREADRRPASDR